MAISQMMFSSGYSPAGGTTWCRQCFNCCMYEYGVAAYQEDSAAIVLRTAGVLSALYIRVATNANATNASTWQLRYATSPSAAMTAMSNANQVISVPKNGTGEYQVSGSLTDTVAAGYCYGLKATDGGSGHTVYTGSISFTPTTNTVVRHANVAGAEFSTASLTGYLPIAGADPEPPLPAESIVMTKVLTTCTAQNLAVNVPLTNSNTNSMTVGLRKTSGASQINGNLTVSIAHAATGMFEDTSDTDSLVAGNHIDYYLTFGSSTVAITIEGIGIELLTTNNKFHIYAGYSFGNSIGTAGTYYYPSGGLCYSYAAYSSETYIQQKNLTAQTFSGEFIFISANTLTGSSSFQLRKNATNANQVISIAATATGEFFDIADEDWFGSSDEINYKLVTVGTGSITLMQYGILAGYTSVTSPLPTFFRGYTN